MGPPLPTQGTVAALTAMLGHHIATGRGRTISGEWYYWAARWEPSPFTWRLEAGGRWRAFAVGIDVPELIGMVTAIAERERRDSERNEKLRRLLTAS